MTTFLIIKTYTSPIAMFPNIATLSTGRFAFLALGALLLIGALGSGAAWLVMFD